MHHVSCMMHRVREASTEVASSDPLKRSTLAEEAYRRVRSMLFSEELDIGEPLSIENLATRLGVSNTPIRSALAKLEAEGLVERIPGHQPTVRGLTQEEIKTLYDFRELVEPYIMHRLSFLISVDEVARASVERLLSELRDGVSDLAGKRTEPITVKVDYALALLLEERSDDHLMSQILGLINSYVLRLRLNSAGLSAGERIGRLVEVSREHCALLESLLSGDERRIEEAVQAHLEQSYRRSSEAQEKATDATRKGVSPEGAVA